MSCTPTTHQRAPNPGSTLPPSFPTPPATTEVTAASPIPSFIDLSLASAALQAHGLPPTDPVVVCHNYTAAGSKDGTTVPFHISPTPRLDFPMSYLAVTSARPYEHVLSLTLQPGVLDYFRQIGIVSPNTIVHEVNPERSADGLLGFPFTDALTQARKQGVSLPQGSSFVTTFPSQLARENALALGLQPIQRSDPALTNNKGLLRLFSKFYNYEVAPGVSLLSNDDISRAVTLFEGTDKAWLKLAHGAGGDLVLPITGPITEEKITAGRDSLYRSVQEAFQRSDYGAGALERFWPADSFAPRLSVITIEKDIGRMGKILGNFSNSMLVHSNGTCETLAYYSQIIGHKGEFLGSAPVTLTPSIQTCVEKETDKIGQLCRGLNLYGLVGVDFFLIQDEKGAIRPIIIEMNGRPSSSLNTHLVATKLGAPYWINIDLHSSRELNTLEDFERHFAQSPIKYPRSSLSEGMVVPLSFSSMYVKEGDSYSLVHPDRKVRVMIASDQSQEHCLDILAELSQYGFKIPS